VLEICGDAGATPAPVRFTVATFWVPTLTDTVPVCGPTVAGEKVTEIVPVLFPARVGL